MPDWAGFLVNLPLLQEHGWRLAAGLRITFQVVAVSFVLGFLLAIPISRARLSRNRVLSGAALCYITVLRGTPLLCQLYLVYYGAGEIRPTLQALGLWAVFRDAFPCCLLVFTLNTAAYQAEIFRGAIASVPRGQVEAAAALGLTPRQAAWRVVYPQAFVVALRPLGNELVGVIKASALTSIVTVLDLMGQTRLVFSRTFDFSVYLYAALLYLALTEAIRRVWLLIERRVTGHLRATAGRADRAGATSPAPAGTALPADAPALPR